MEINELIHQTTYGFVEAFVIFSFFSRLTNKKGKILLYALFGFMECIVILLPITVLSKLAIMTFLLFLNGIYAFELHYRTSMLYALLVIELLELCWGVSDSITELLFPFLFCVFPMLFGYMLMIAGMLLTLCLLGVCWFVVPKFLQQKDTNQEQYVSILLIPLLLIFFVSVYIKFNPYENKAYFQLTPTREVFQKLTMQILAVGSVAVVLYTWKKIKEQFFLDTRLAMLEQQSHFQKQYVEEARMRYERTKSLRHDMKNHLTVVKGLLNKGEVEKANAYIAEMDVAIEYTAFPFSTNRPVLDILLENKLALAKHKGIEVKGSLKVPPSCVIKDMDLCILLSNALDNAIHACEKTDANIHKYIRMSSQSQGDFLIIEIENSFDGCSNYKKGTGLSNILLVTEQYHGTMNIRMEGNIFSLYVLLIISQHP